MTEASQAQTGSPSLPRFAGAGSPRKQHKGWWLWLLLVALVLGLATAAMVMVNRGPQKTLAQNNALNPTGSTTSVNSTAATNTPAGPATSATTPTATNTATTPAATTTPAPATNSAAPAAATGTTADVIVNDFTPQLRHGLSLIADGKLVEGRTVLSDLYVSSYHELTREDAQAIRDTLTSVNQDLVFGPKVAAGDPLVELYEVKAGDVLTRVTLKYKVPYPLVELINKTQANRIRVGQKLKMIQGPMHATVRKGEFRMDVFVNGPEGKPVYVRSFPVGLGEEDSTPPGMWVLSGKVQNPSWTNPRTRQSYAADDPTNPIGEFWIGLQGTEEGTKDKRGYGIHGTVEPESIGRMMSMGCIRLRHDDIALLFKMLYDKLSTVKVEP